MSKNLKKAEKREMSDIKRIVLFTLVIVIVVFLIGLTSFFVLKDNAHEKVLETTKTNTKEIFGYGITVDDLDSDLYRLEFEKLKANLEGESINYDDYAESVARLFLIDLYTIKTKINKYDVGGIELVLPDAKENFRINVTDTIYKYVEDNSKGKRKQSLPVVSELKVLGVKKEEFKFENEKVSLPAYVFDISINYSEDLGYDNKAEVRVVNKDDRMYVVEKN